MTRIGISAFVAAFLIGIVHATIRTVPTNYATIQSACNNAQMGDTVLLNPGVYYESISLNTNLTFASRWIFSHDTLDIDSVKWHSPLRIMIMPSDGLRFQLEGIRFVAMPTPVDSARLIVGSNDTIQMNSCRIEGVFTTTRYFSTGLIDLYQSSCITMNDCRYSGDSVAATPLIRCSTAFITRCFFSGRTNSTQYRELMPALRTYNLTLTDSYFDIRGEGITASNYEIRRNIFVNCNQFLFAGGGVGLGTSLIDSCLFDSITTLPGPSVISLSSQNRIPIIRRSVFQNATGSSHALIYSYRQVLIEGVRFYGIEGFSAAIEGNSLTIDSCRFVDVHNPILKRRDLQSDTAKIEFCDFIRSAPFLGGVNQFDSVPAPNCYWGDPTGPNHPQNPNGQGMVIPNYVNPFPFRTTPVFPENGIFDPRNRVTYLLPNSLQFSLYPNPTNASTTIRFSVPIASPMRGELYDRTGRLVTNFAIDHKYFSHGQYPIQLVDTPSGLYFVRLSSSQASTTQPLVIVK